MSSVPVNSSGRYIASCSNPWLPWWRVGSIPPQSRVRVDVARDRQCLRFRVSRPLLHLVRQPAG